MEHLFKSSVNDPQPLQYLNEVLFYQYFTYEKNFDENIAAATLPMQLPTTEHFCLPETSNLLFKSYSLFAKFKHKGCKYF